MYAAYCCGISGLSCVLFDLLPCPGGQCTALYPSKKTYGVPGLTDIKASDFVDLLKRQVYSVDSVVCTFSERVTDVFRGNGTLDINNKFRAKHIIMATGIGEMKPCIAGNIKGITRSDDFIQYYCMKMDLYKDKNVIIAGGGDSAADFAINISSIAKKVVVIHRRDKMTCDQHKFSQILQNNKVELKLSQSILEIEPDKTVVTDVETFNNMDYIVFCYGFVAEPCSIRGLDLANSDGLIGVDINTMQTKNENVFAIGDAVTYKNKKKNIVSCFFEADRAVRQIKSAA